MRVAGIDFGIARIGVALSDERKILASPLSCITFEHNLKFTAKKLSLELAKHTLEAIVIGLPLHLSGKESPLSEQVRLFASHLKEYTSVPLIFWDERLTTALVTKAMKEGGVKRKKRMPVIDALAATVILQSYLDSKVS